MNYKIKLADLSDISDLVLLEDICFVESKISRRSFIYFIKKSRATILILLNDENIICGYIVILYRPNSKCARIYSFAVLPKYRGLGYGKALLNAAEEFVKKNSYNCMSLEVRKDNSFAINLYERLGFKEIKKIHNYYEDNTPALKMMKVF